MCVSVLLLTYRGLYRSPFRDNFRFAAIFRSGKSQSRSWHQFTHRIRYSHLDEYSRDMSFLCDLIILHSVAINDGIYFLSRNHDDQCYSSFPWFFFTFHSSSACDYISFNGCARNVTRMVCDCNFPSPYYRQILPLVSWNAWCNGRMISVLIMIIIYFRSRWNKCNWSASVYSFDGVWLYLSDYTDACTLHNDQDRLLSQRLWVSLWTIHTFIVILVWSLL